MTDVELRLTADVDQATKNVGGFRKEYADLVKTLEKPLRQVNAFRELESSLEGTQREARSARERVRDLGNEMARTANPSKELTASYRDAVSELRRLERAEATAQGRLVGRRRELQAAGVDTRNLAMEQQRLTRSLRQHKRVVATSRLPRASAPELRRLLRLPVSSGSPTLKRRALIWVSIGTERCRRSWDRLSETTSCFAARAT